VEYIHNPVIAGYEQKDLLRTNPVIAGFINEPEHWKYSSSIDYSGGNGSLDFI
jgi:hypothetical protein